MTGLWSALEGSLLLWLLILAALAAIMSHVVPRRAAELHPWAMAVMTSVLTFFFGVALLTGRAFARVSPVPADGPGPNPLLQDHPLMGVHPPLLYLGYVGFTVPFAYAVSALVTGRLDRDWLVVSRRWLLVAWAALTVGITMGAWWSYEVLGWGGYWAWDPVENASILPWFTATALLHSVMVQERRSILRIWNVVLAASTFLLVLIGTFITRSGVLASVHAFTQSALGPVLLGYIAVVALGVVVLLVWRGDRLGPVSRIESTVSRESVFLVNNVLFVALAVTVLLGTTFPLLVEAVSGDRVSVGAPYFNRMVVPLALAVVLLMGVGPVLPWDGREASAALRRLRLPALTGLGTVAVLGGAGLPHPGTIVAFGLAAFSVTAAAGTALHDVRKVRAAGERTWLLAAVRAVRGNRRRYGGLIAHVGIVLAAVAVAGSSSYASTAERTLRPGESITVAGHTATLVRVERQRTPRFMQVRVLTELSGSDRRLGVYTPALRFYPSMNEAIGRPSVRTGLTSDAYLTVSSAAPDGSTATVRLTVTPLVVWLWAAGVLVACGALFAALPRRPRKRSTAAAGESPAGVESTAADSADSAPGAAAVSEDGASAELSGVER
ncbi:heme lyase CcmF/NrfE family subunit [Streptomyces caeni]|uniref:Heme lyase CcmF/NrfE family subunit n=1 Tax=Streptomyces caeni TaxID=2307231 RepID=A0ABW4IQJ3_9ACTN